MGLTGGGGDRMGVPPVRQATSRQRRVEAVPTLRAASSAKAQREATDRAVPDRPVVAITIPGLVTVSANVTLRENRWVDRRRAKVQIDAVGYWLLALGKPDLPVTALLVRLSTSELDDDNLRGALKHCRDAVARWFAVDDRDPRITWTYAQEKIRRDSRRLQLGGLGMPAQCGVRIEIRARAAT